MNIRTTPATRPAPWQMRTMGAKAGWATVGAALVLGACSSGGGPQATPATSTVPVASTAPATPGVTTTPTTGFLITTKTFAKLIRVGTITFHAPESWDIAGGPPTAYVGVLAGGRGDIALRVQTGFTGPIDSLAPTTCLGAPPSAPASVDLVEQGFRPVGDRTAEFRFWRSSCPNGDLKVEEHRAWLLPVSQIAIFEQHHLPEVEAVVESALVDRAR